MKPLKRVVMRCALTSDVPRFKLQQLTQVTQVKAAAKGWGVTSLEVWDSALA